MKKSATERLIRKTFRPPREADYPDKEIYRKKKQVYDTRINRVLVSLNHLVALERAEARKAAIVECRGIARNTFPESSKWRGAYKGAGKMIATEIGRLLPERERQGNGEGEFDEHETADPGED